MRISTSPLSMRVAGLAVIMALGLGYFAPETAYAKSAGTKFRIRLSGSLADPLASGKAAYQKRGNRERLSVQAEDLSSASSVDIYVDGVLAGTGRVRLGAADLNLDSRRGHTIPAVTRSSLIEVYDSDTGVLLVSS